MRNFLLVGGFLLGFLAPTQAAEISTNGTGGGLWSEPATWTGKSVPGPKDDVIVRKYDLLTFDRNDEDKISCRKLQIDPKGVFVFKTGVGKIVCTVAEGIESYGTMKLDGTKSARDFLELRLLGDTAEKRKLKLRKGGGLLLYGKAKLPDGRHNVLLSSPQEGKQKENLFAIVETDGVVSIDWQRALVNNVKLIAMKIDNTGAKPNERINVIDNQFIGQARVFCHTCDTPVIAGNTFEFKGAKPIEEAAIQTSYSPLAEIKNNVIHGGFLSGISVTYQSDSVLIGNTVERCTTGIYGGYGIPNTMVKKCLVRGCDKGLRLEGGSGVVEDVTIEGAKVAFNIENAHLQLTNFHIKDLDPKGMAVLFEGGTLTLLNCNIAPSQIKIGPQPATAKETPVTSLQYAVIRAQDAPAGALVEVRTAKPALAVDAADPNVRNSPAPLSGGLTPLPSTLNPLILKAWTLDLQGKLQASPEYTVKLLGPAVKEGDTRPDLKAIPFRPLENAYRAKLDDSAPTLEVRLK